MPLADTYWERILSATFVKCICQNYTLYLSKLLGVFVCSSYLVKVTLVQWVTLCIYKALEISPTWSKDYAPDPIHHWGWLAGTPFDSSQKYSHSHSSYVHIIKYIIRSVKFNPLRSNFPVLCFKSGEWVLKVSIWPIHVSSRHIWNIWPTVSCPLLLSALKHSPSASFSH